MKVLVADDHPLTLFGTANFIISLGFEVCDMCNNGIIAFNRIQALQPDIAILDINMPGMDGIEILEKLQQMQVKTKVVLLTMHNERSIYTKAIECGAYGYLLKNFSSEELEACLKAVSINQRYASSHLEKELLYKNGGEQNEILPIFTLTERKVLKLISQQRNTRQIAVLLFLSEKTIEGHRRNIIEKLKLPERKEPIVDLGFRK